MKVLVAMKQVADPDRADKIRVFDDRIDATGLDGKINPFDECAVEAALRLTEDGKAPTKRRGEVVVVSLGPPAAETAIRSALAMGADRALRIDTTDEALDGRRVAHALRAIVERERPDLVLLGKQTADGDGQHVGQALGAMLDYPTVASVVGIRQKGSSLEVQSGTESTLSTFRIVLPAVLTVDLRIVAAKGVYSDLGDSSFEYYDGVRFAALRAVMCAKKKPLAVLRLEELQPQVEPLAHYTRFEAAPQRNPGVRVKDVSELAEKLIHEAGVW